MMFVVLAANYKVYGGDYTYRIMSKKLSWTGVKSSNVIHCKSADL